MKGLISALTFLTLSRRFAGARLTAEDIGDAVVYFPLVGLGLGFILLGLNTILGPYLESEILAAVLVTALIVLTGAVHLQELQKTADGSAEKTTDSGASSSPVQIYGLLTVMLTVFFKIRSLEVIGEGVPLTLLIVPMVARWSVIVAVYRATSDGEPIRRVVERVKAWHLLLTSAVVLAITAYVLKVPGLWTGFSVSVLALSMRTLLQQRRGEIRQDDLGALIELSEALGFVLIASL
jgi:adenosylcobinamide-GDP ribazoletransferase